MCVAPIGAARRTTMLKFLTIDRTANMLNTSLRAGQESAQSPSLWPASAPS